MLPPPLSRTSGLPGALRVFRDAAEHVPAYRDFLRVRGIAPGDIRTAADFAALPALTKQNYIAVYPAHQLLPHGRITGAETWSASSGSSGEPTYWARGPVALRQSIELHRRILRGLGADRRPTLVVIGFAMGSWIGGTYTYQAITALHRRGFPVSVITPGVDVAAIRAGLRTLGPQYGRVVLAGYPPFLRDVLDEPGIADGVDLRLLMAGENIGEPWRDHVLELAGKPGRPEFSTLIYGTADLGMIGHETATTIAVRRYAERLPALRRLLFGDAGSTPTFVEYDPGYRYVEPDASGALLFTAHNAIPLVRYRINDEGTVFGSRELRAALRDAGCPPPRPITRGARYLVLNGRTDVAATFYSVNITPDAVRTALADARLVRTLTGKHLLDTVADDRFRSELVLRVQLRPGIRPEPGLAALVRQATVATLCRVSSEYRELHRVSGVRAEPTVLLDEFDSPEYSYRVKHRPMRQVA
ncbi:phenylacetate--CoA ligase family protein [Nocardia harenae]|uniref:phenylacetate--CoA ligase family protein n=1 Tax=Nocardia harenae TaxID=358707 RepID=UPI0008308F36|nr:phenylacetate--CoA ligase family protein [Nocardia harenae]